MNEDSIEIGFNFLQQMDDYIKLNYKTMTCQDIYDIYLGFFDTLKIFRCHSNGFWGFPEFLIFRFVFHALGGKFKYKSLTENTMNFVSTTDKKLVIGQGIRMNIRGKPDILIQYAEKPISVIEIKTVPTNGEKTIIEVKNNFTNWREEYPELNALLLIFWEVKDTTKCFSSFKKLKGANKRNNFLILNNEENRNEKLFPLLDEYLKLSEIKAKILPIQR